MANKNQASISISREFQRRMGGSVGLAILLAWVTFGSMAGCDSSPAGTKSTAAGTVQLEIEFGGRRENISVDIPCSAESTVFQILLRARNIGDLEFVATGTGETTFVRSIDGVENEGAGGDNWVFRINEKLGDRGCGVFPVRPGDHVLWVLGEYP